MSRTLSLTYTAASRHVEPSEMIRAALAHIIDPARWTRGDFFDGDASCAMGAFARTSEYERPLMVNVFDYHQMMAVLLKTLRDSLPDVKASTIDEFNDHPDVRHQDIVAAFEKSAAFFEEQGR